MSRLSRAEAVAIIREASKQFPDGHGTLKDVAATLCAWAVFADDALAQLQRGATQAAEEHHQILAVLAEQEISTQRRFSYCPSCGQKVFTRA